LAGAVMDGVFSGPDVFHPEILKNEPVTVDGVSGFRVLYSFKTATGLKKKGVYTGFIAEKWFYFLRYSAPEQHYFEHDLEVYDRMVRSFRLLKTPG
ncbi:MAG TPA: hypothetical protein VLB09_03470, partial [Nitrospiria bacterium]|nr:hypothetical protein [Nitrospiria bacterium]